VAVDVTMRGPEVREVFLERMAATFSPEAVRRKAVAWDWLFARRLGEEQSSTFVLAATLKGEFVGGSILGVSLFQYDGREHVTYSPYGTSIDPSVRGLGLNLIKALYALPTLAIGIPAEEKLARVNERLGAISKPRLQMFKVLRAGSAFARRKSWAAPLAMPGDALWRVWRAAACLTGPRLERDESITPETRFGADYEAFWHEARRHHPFIMVRDAAYMTWRFVEMPVQSYEVLFLRKAGAVKGFVVVGTNIDPSTRMGQIADILVADDDERSLSLLLAAGSERLARLGAEIAALGCCEDTALQAAARQAGFLHSKLSRPAQVNHVDAAVHERLQADIADLYLTRGDQDEDF
jgi:hypothetical protein